MWNERYTEAFTAYGTEPNDLLRDHARQIPMGSVACLAEGEGRNAVFLAKLGYDVTAIDSSEVGLKNARQLAKENGVEIKAVLADLAEFDLGERRWDGIVSIWAHVHESVRAGLHAACVRALKPGGVLLLEAYTPRQLEEPGLGGPSSLEYLMTPDGLRRELSGLRFDRCEEVVRDIREGECHVGQSATVQVIAVKP